LLLLSTALAILAGCAAPASPRATLGTAPAGIDWSATPATAVGLSDFDFTPSHVVFRAGQPVRLVLTNSGSGRHDFSAPAFFAAAAYRPGTTMPADGKIVVDKNQTAEVDLVPGAAGTYPLDCTEFLHTMFGMTGTITVTAR
jgi:uncharacterized cupredoxin-like copper-binding protein